MGRAKGQNEAISMEGFDLALHGSRRGAIGNQLIVHEIADSSPERLLEYLSSKVPRHQFLAAQQLEKLLTSEENPVAQHVRAQIWSGMSDFSEVAKDCLIKGQIAHMQGHGSHEDIARAITYLHAGSDDVKTHHQLLADAVVARFSSQRSEQAALISRLHMEGESEQADLVSQELYAANKAYNDAAQSYFDKPHSLPLARILANADFPDGLAQEQFYSKLSEDPTLSKYAPVVAQRMAHYYGAREENLVLQNFIASNDTVKQGTQASVIIAQIDEKMTKTVTYDRLHTAVWSAMGKHWPGEEGDGFEPLRRHMRENFVEQYNVAARAAGLTADGDELTVLGKEVLAHAGANTVSVNYENYAGVLHTLPESVRTSDAVMAAVDNWEPIRYSEVVALQEAMLAEITLPSGPSEDFGARYRRSYALRAKETVSEEIDAIATTLTVQMRTQIIAGEPVRYDVSDDVLANFKQVVIGAAVKDNAFYETLEDSELKHANDVLDGKAKRLLTNPKVLAQAISDAIDRRMQKKEDLRYQLHSTNFRSEIFKAMQKNKN